MISLMLCVVTCELFGDNKVKGKPFHKLDISITTNQEVVEKAKIEEQDGFVVNVGTNAGTTSFTAFTIRELGYKIWGFMDLGFLGFFDFVHLYFSFFIAFIAKF